MPGRLDKTNAAYVLETLKRAVTGCLSGEFDALVTGPAHKGNINDAGFAFTGHTEFLAGSAPTAVHAGDDAGDARNCAWRSSPRTWRSPMSRKARLPVTRY